MWFRRDAARLSNQAAIYQRGACASGRDLLGDRCDSASNDAASSTELLSIQDGHFKGRVTKWDNRGFYVYWMATECL